jgi:hypothetical protein
MNQIFPSEIIAKGDIPVISRRLSDGQIQRRRIRLQEKNWRLVGDMVSGKGLDLLAEGDFFWSQIDTSGPPPYELVWDVVTASGNADLHERISRESYVLKGGMGSWSFADPIADYFANLVGLAGGTAAQPYETPSNPEEKRADLRESEERPPFPSKPFPKRPEAKLRRRKRIDERLRRPHILVQIVKTGMVLSAKAQTDFLDILDTLSVELRKLFSEASLLKKVEIDHRKAWSEFKDRRLGFVDAGMANVDAVGAAPVAIRVGSYIVTPGQQGPSREEFGFELELVDDLYESATSGTGIYEDLFEDLAKLRDAARISCEIAGLLGLTLRRTPPEIVMLHGPLVNPVSPYALGIPGEPSAFPNFTPETIRKLLPHNKSLRSGREANFVSVYLDQLKRLESGEAMVCGVVERPSLTVPGPLICRVIEQMHSDASNRRSHIQRVC